jgi:hypothetical protein
MNADEAKDQICSRRTSPEDAAGCAKEAEKMRYERSATQLRAAYLRQFPDRCLVPAVGRSRCRGRALLIRGYRSGWVIDSRAMSTSRSGQWRWCGLGRRTLEI